MGLECRCVLENFEGEYYKGVVELGCRKKGFIVGLYGREIRKVLGSLEK